MAESLHSAPPPTAGPPGAGNRHEHIIELESSRSWKRQKSVDFVKFSPLGMELHHTGVLVMPLTMPLGAIALATTETGPVKPMTGEEVTVAIQKAMNQPPDVVNLLKGLVTTIE